MKAFYFVLLSVLGLVSCKPQSVYDKLAYEEIMNNSVQLHALEQKGRVYPGIISRLPDTLYVNERLPKEVVDSINKARKLEYKK